MTARILFISDSHLFRRRNETLFGANTFQNLRTVSASITTKEKPFDLLVALGDLSHDGSPESYQDFHLLTKDLAHEIVWLSGNHDDFSMLDSSLLPYLQTTWNRGNWHLLFLNSSQNDKEEGLLNPEAIEKMKDFLQHHKGEHLMICLHHQPVAVGSRFIDQLGLTNHQEFWEIMKDHREVKAVLFGHVHQEVDKTYHGFRLLSVPATSVPFKPGSDQLAFDSPKQGYRIITLFPGGRFNTRVEMNHADMENLMGSD